MGRPTICFCSIAFRNEPIEQIIPRLAEAGYDAVEIFAGQIEGRSDAELDRLRAIADGCGLRIAVLSPYFWLTRDLPELVERSLRSAAWLAGAARRLGATRIRTFVDAGPDGIGSAKATPEHWERAVGLLRRITAQAPDILFPVETHQWTLADTPETALQLIERVGAKNLVINYQQMEPDPLRGYRLLKPHIRHFHLQNPHGNGGSGYLDEGDSPLVPLLREALRDGYDGTMSVEYCWKGVEWPKAYSARAWLKGHGL